MSDRKTILISIFLLLVGIVSAQDVQLILTEAAKVYEQSNGIKADFVLLTRSEQQKMSESFEGIVNMKDEKFTLSTPDSYTWFDGITQWTYVERTDEVNITTPTGEELQFTNPALLLRSYKKGFSAEYKGESTATNGKAAYDIVLMPKKKGDIEKVELQIEKFSHLPASITVIGKNGIHTTIRISKLSTGINQPDSFFVFKETDYPDAELIDLR